MPFNSLCTKKIFQDIPNLNEIKVDPHVDDVFSGVFTGMGGRYTRLRILCEIIEIPLNMHQIANRLDVDYKTVQYNIKVLQKHNLVIRKGSGYADLLYPSPIVTENLPTLYAVIRKVEARLDDARKNYID